MCVCVPCCAELAEALGCLAKAPASEITLAMTGEDSVAPADPGGEETVGRKQIDLITFHTVRKNKSQTRGVFRKTDLWQKKKGPRVSDAPDNKNRNCTQRKDYSKKK